MENKIKEYRIAAQLTQGKLAEKVGCTERAIRNYEAGRQIPNAQIIIRIAKALNTKVDILYDTV